MLRGMSRAAVTAAVAVTTAWTCSGMRTGLGASETRGTRDTTETAAAP